MPPAKARPPAADDSRTDGNSTKTPSAAQAKKSKNAAVTQFQAALQNGGSVEGKDSTNGSNGTNGVNASGTAALSAQGAEMSWNSAPLSLLDTYRTAYNLPTPSAFTSVRRQALLTNPGIGRHSPTMARQKDKRRVSKDQLALAVRKHFNSAAVNEIDVVVEVIYRVKNQDKAFRMRSAPGGVKKA